jgi:5-methylcytosine-specific restriction endonuclease McrA
MTIECKACGGEVKPHRFTRQGGFCRPCSKTPYRRLKKDSCGCCGFVPVHPAQLDVDHIDGNHANNSPDNLQTLCANCHRLKTVLNGDVYAKPVVEDNVYTLPLFD